MASAIFDELDRQIVQALQIDGRAPFSRVGAALGVADQTVARRYRRMVAAGALRVFGVPNTHQFGHGHWMIRLRCVPDAVRAVADALARRSDTSWVHLLSAGTEISCNIRSWTAEEHNALLLHKLPRTAQVQSITAQQVIHYFAGAMAGYAGGREWVRLGVLSDEQVALLAAATSEPAETAGSALEPEDRELITALALDGRRSHAELATTLRRSESSVRRRLEALRALGALYFDVDVSFDIIGPHVAARMWLSVAPADLIAVGTAMASHPEIVFAAATTGPTNLVAVAVCEDGAGLFRYLTQRIGALPTVRDVETAPVVRTVKREVMLVPE
ncbi:DNA-binding transcriptional regulator, Lrp family [Parafrankia irregularis]|uniref:DNA-binding transcriptional regulator, Lrp family n=1 Tax=Parafrankia irregularis TaxID=795642 RepID=A0A0S4QJ68_9ACTN|nr:MULTISPECIES: AsnC family transcriptional regulator [Parafrankia]MBE3203821.1 AsnC family transcriptional regulator [Parafrankia sp. CH37]CUU55310.1 DNA-binding transcriptional regulator, Lrp family [Parafrankia irregularis]